MSLRVRMTLIARKARALLRVHTLLAGVLALGITCIILDQLFPPPLHKGDDLSTIVLDRDGYWLHGFTNSEGKWRLPVTLDEVDQSFIDRLVRIEDKRFFDHGGVDLVAVGRAGWLALRRGKIVSGASTITMQTVRVLEPRPRTIPSKLIEMFRAVQIERRLSKAEILTLYLNLTPYGGNIEGVRSASRIWFDKEPALLTTAEQALLIALPQAPEARRPDRRHGAARRARTVMLDRLAQTGMITQAQADEEKATRLPKKRTPLARHAWHQSYELASKQPKSTTIKSTLDIRLQQAASRLVGEVLNQSNDENVQASILIIENATNEVRALIGSGGVKRAGGWINMSNAVRSPGSTLKPFIYALAFEDGSLHANSVVDDMPRYFGDYRPENFDRTSRGQVRVREALQHSLNVPAVAALNVVGSARFASSLNAAGAPLRTRRLTGEAPGLALALGGAGISMRDLGVLYTALATDGVVRPLKESAGAKAAKSYRLMSQETARTISEILRSAPSLAGRMPSRLTQGSPQVAFKTGTSYGFRDAWAAGYAHGHTVIVWVGRADGGTRRGQTGRKAAAPILFSLVDILADYYEAPASDPHENLPQVATRFHNARGEVAQKPAIVFPPADATLIMDRDDETFQLVSQGGTGEPSWYVNGKPVQLDLNGNQSVWEPDGQGYHKVSVVDKAGRSSEVVVHVLQRWQADGR